MYCDKLKSIVQQPNSSNYNIDEVMIKKLDKFINEKTTLKERNKLNPYRFAIEMNVPQETAVMVFILGHKTELFYPRFYYSCYCGEQFEVINVEEEFECTCGEVITPKQEKNRLFLYFKLLETRMPCDLVVKELLLPLDLLEKEGHGTENFTLADVDQLLGENYTEDLISLKEKRDERFQQFLEEEDRASS